MKENQKLILSPWKLIIWQKKKVKKKESKNRIIE